MYVCIATICNLGKKFYKLFAKYLLLAYWNENRCLNVCIKDGDYWWCFLEAKLNKHEKWNNTFFTIGQSSLKLERGWMSKHVMLSSPGVDLVIIRHQIWTSSRTKSHPHHIEVPGTIHGWWDVPRQEEHLSGLCGLTFFWVVSWWNLFHVKTIVRWLFLGVSFGQPILGDACWETFGSQIRLSKDHPLASPPIQEDDFSNHECSLTFVPGPL